MKYLFLIATIITTSVTYIKAQDFTHSTEILNINKDSLYKIELKPNWKQFMKFDYSDVRIYNSKHQETPYIILNEPVLKSKSDFVEYEIISQNHFSSYSEIVIHNPNKDKISNIAFNINNSDAYKYCSIEGSDDKKQWYSISELQELNLVYNNQYTNQYKCIYFPLSNYKYFRLSVDDWFSHPLKINSAGYFKNSVIAGKLNSAIFTDTIIQDTKNKKTLICLQFKNNQQINRIDFKISEPRLFMRHAKVYVKRTQQLKHKTETYNEIVSEFNLQSGEPLFFDVNNVCEKELWIEIENKDNPPLQIENIECKQLATFLIADFKVNEKYILMSGDSTLKAPEYDLGNFIHQIPQLLPEAILQPMTTIALPANEIKTKKEPAFFETKTFLWICLGVGVLIISFFSISLLKDMRKKENL